MQGIEESERDNLKRALNSLGSIGELVKVIGELPYTHAQAHALGQLWRAIGAAFIIGSRGIKNPLTQKFLNDNAARARSAKRTDEINEIVARRVTGCKNSKRVGNKAGTAAEELAGVNSDLEKLGIKPLSKEGLRKRIARL
jgi:hypothetical protein